MDTAPLARRLGLPAAVAIGLGSMIGAGVFTAFAPAAAAAGPGLLIGLGIAAAIAYLNATASAQLAAQYPTSGGTYVYGRERIGQWAGFFAGWAFVVGKTASCAAMALAFAAYVAPVGWEKPVAITAVLVLAVVNTFGVTRTAALTTVFVAVTLLVLALVVIAGLSSGGMDAARISPSVWASSPLGVLQSAGILFFAFAGYARIATMGEEVRDPARTIPRAIVLALASTVVVYAVIGVVSLLTLGPARLAAAGAPLVEVATAGGWNWTGTLVRAGAAVASLGALLALIAGVGRTTLAMARNADLPRWLAAVHHRYAVPHRAELVLAVVVSVLIAVTDLRGAIGFSSFGVLLYYAVANVAAFRQDAGHRRYPRAFQVVGALGCVVLAFTLPWQAVVGGVAVLVVGLAVRAIRIRATRS